MGLVNIDAFTTANPENGDGEIMIQIHNGGNLNYDVGNYFWSIRLVGKGSGNVDMWGGILIPQEYGFHGFKGKPVYGDNLMTIGSPGTGEKIISVGSYQTKNTWLDMDSTIIYNSPQTGILSLFSSHGPNRNGKILPTISAPGETIFSCLSGNLTIGEGVISNDILFGGYYRGMNGTSMASPHVTGVVALMLQVNPALDFPQVENILQSSARTDVFTGNTPNNDYGAGKVNAFEAVKMAETTSVNDNTENKGIKIYPSPANSFVNIEIQNLSGNNEITIYNWLGEKVSKNISTEYFGSLNIFRMNVSELPSGIYFVTINIDSGVESAKFAVTK
jgi:subtilisin family serine protease